MFAAEIAGNRQHSNAGEKTATVIAAIPNALEMASRRQPKALDSGSRNRLNVFGMMAGKADHDADERSESHSPSPKTYRAFSGVLLRFHHYLTCHSGLHLLPPSIGYNLPGRYCISTGFNKRQLSED
jgi:hypothetical protein